jgi:acylglycerol lipase
MHEHVTVTPAGDGYRLRSLRWLEGPSDTLVVMLHGVLTHSGWFSEVGDALLARGFHAVGHDRRGSGMNDEDRGDVPSAAHWLDDLDAVVRPLRDRYARIVYLGWCLGSCVALQYLLERPEMGEGLIFMSPDIYERHITERVRSVLGRPEWRDRTAPRFTVPIPLDGYTDTEALDRFVRADRLKLTTCTPRLMYASLQLKRDLESRFHAFTKPSVLLLAAKDTIIDNEPTEALYRHIGSPESQVVIVDAHHGMMFEALDSLVGLIERFATSVPVPVRA